MNITKAAVSSFLFMAIASSVIFFSSCSKEIKDGSVIFTQVVGKTKDINNLTITSWRYNVQSRIAAIDPHNPDKTLKVLTSDLYSALSPRISFDGKFLLFAGQKSQSDNWQIWEIRLKDIKTRQITNEKGSCIDPAYLPDGKIVFSKLDGSDPISKSSLYTCYIDGSNLRKITFNPLSNICSNVLNDGRILTISHSEDSEKKGTVLMVLRPDGTKSELFYNSSELNTLFGPVCESPDGRIIFIESENNSKSTGDLISISYNRPLHSRINYTSEINGSFQSASFLRSGILLVSYKPSENEKYSLYEFDTDSRTLGKKIYSSAEFEAVEAVVTESRIRPKKLPSEVDMGVKTGLLLCQDINFTGIISGPNATSLTIADRIEIIGSDSSLGVVEVERDGSFYLKVIADIPFRIRRVDKNGNVSGESCEWIYLRPNERRGCVGCHENHELTPENRMPLAVRKSPALVPVNKTKIIEKAIELE